MAPSKYLVKHPPPFRSIEDPVEIPPAIRLRVARAESGVAQILKKAIDVRLSA